jgi:hypothetical protein
MIPIAICVYKECREMFTLKTTHVDIRKFGILLIIMSFILSFVYPIFRQPIIRLCEQYLSSDHQITPNGMREFISTYYFMIGMLIVIGFFLIKVQKDYWRKRIKHIFLDEPLCPGNAVRPSPRSLLTISSVVGLFLILSMRLAYRFPFIYPFLYKKDYGLIDLCVPTIMIISAVLLGVAVWKLWNGQSLIKYRVMLSVVYSILVFLFVFYAGEEMSWGQDFFRWQTPAIFSGNVENQTNLHNYFNAYFNYGYIALSLILVFVFASVWLEFNQRWLPLGRLVLPHPSLIGLSLLITFVSIVWFPEQELLEEMMAAFVLFYSLRIFTCLRTDSLCSA